MFKKLLLLLLFLGLLSLSTYVALSKNFIPRQSLGGVPFQAAEQMSTQVGNLVSRSQPTITHVQTVQKQTGAVLGDFIQVNEKDSEKKLYEKTLEQAQYLYCKQVVEQWESETISE